MMHQLISQNSKDGITTKCGRSADRGEATVWWSDVDCTDCRPYRFVPAKDGLGMEMVQVGETVLPDYTTPPLTLTKKVKRRGAA